MTAEETVEATRAFVKRTLGEAEPGHDAWHAIRVWQNALRIAVKEPCDRLTVELGALLHDIADHKFTRDEQKGPRLAAEFLEAIGVEKEVIAHVVKIMENISFKGGNVAPGFFSPELAVVMDADRLDAMGAIGIARAFSYGGHKGRVFYDPSVRPVSNMTVEQYKASSAPTINHFYEKLLLLKERMNTTTGRTMAERRHRFMELYLEEFFEEWGEKGAW